MADDRSEAPKARGFWSGTISFGLVSVPVDLYAAVRPRRVALRQLGPDGCPLVRRYVCSRDGRVLSSDEIVRGYAIGGPTDEGAFVVVSDDELEALEPEKSREIDLRQFVDREELDPRLIDRGYILAPSGQSTKAYHLLAEVMERRERAGIATFVMRGREYLVAIFAERGLLRAATLRFADELRTPAEVGLPEAEEVPGNASTRRKRRRAMKAAVEALEAEELDESLLRDEEADALIELARHKRAEGRDVVEVPEELAEDEEADQIVDIMKVLEERMGAA